MISIDGISDLYLDSTNFKVQTDYNADILLFAGNLCAGINLEIWNSFCKSLDKKYGLKFIVLGNYDYYGHKIFNAYTILRKFLNDNFPTWQILQNEAYEFDNYRIIGSTFHTEIRGIILSDTDLVSQDLKNITNFKEVKDPLEERNRYHLSDKNATRLLLDGSKKDTNIILTHFPPINTNITKDDYLSVCDRNYITNNVLDMFTVKTLPDFLTWHYGHLHNKRYNCKIYKNFKKSNFSIFTPSIQNSNKIIQPMRITI